MRLAAIIGDNRRLGVGLHASWHAV